MPACYWSSDERIRCPCSGNPRRRVSWPTSGRLFRRGFNRPPPRRHSCYRLIRQPISRRVCCFPELLSCGALGCTAGRMCCPRCHQLLNLGGELIFVGENAGATQDIPATQRVWCGLCEPRLRLWRQRIAGAKVIPGFDQRIARILHPRWRRYPITRAQVVSSGGAEDCPTPKSLPLGRGEFGWGGAQQERRPPRKYLLSNEYGAFRA